MNTTLTPVITSAGLNAIWNAQHDGLEATIAEIALGEAGWTPDNSATALKDEKRRIPVAGARVNETQIHLTGVEDGTAEYWVREVGFYLADGTLLAIWSAAEQALAYKSAGVDLLLAFDLVLTALPADSVTVDGSAGFMLPPATDSKRGLIRIATADEARGGKATDVAVNPAQLKQIADRRKAADAYKLDGHDANYFATASAVARTQRSADGKVSKSGDTMTGRLNFNNLDNPICLVDRNKNASADKNIGLGLISGRLERIGNLETHLYLEQYKNIDYRFCIRLTKFGSDQFWSFRSDGHLYGPHGKIVNAKDEAFSVGSYVIAVLNPSINTRLIYKNNAILPGSHILRSNIGGDLGSDNIATTWRAGKWGSDSLPGTWRVMTPINAHVETSTSAAWCSINLFKRIF